MWVYINTYPKKFPVFGVCYANKIIEKNPMLGLYFDKLEKVVGKIFLRNKEVILIKAMDKFIDLVKNFKL